MSSTEDLWGPPGCNRTVRVPCPGIPLNVRPEVEELFLELVRWLTVERKKAGAPPLNSSGGYNKRYVRGSTTRWSNHSWGLAADFNAASNPMSSTLITDMPPGTEQKAVSLGMRWGGSYRGRKDPMHFEVVVGPDEVKRLVADLRRPPIPVTPAKEMKTVWIVKDPESNKQYLTNGIHKRHIKTQASLEQWKRDGAKQRLMDDDEFDSIRDVTA